MKIILVSLILLGHALATSTIDKNRRQVVASKGSAGEDIHDPSRSMKESDSTGRHDKLARYTARIIMILHGINREKKRGKPTDAQLRFFKRAFAQFNNQKGSWERNKQPKGSKATHSGSIDGNVSSKTEARGRMSQRLVQMKRSVIQKPLMYLKKQRDIGKNYLHEHRRHLIFLAILAVVLLTIIFFSLSFLIMHSMFSQHAGGYEPLLEQPIVANPNRGLEQV